MPRNALVAPSVDEAVRNAFGMQPGMDRLNLLPRYSAQEGLVAPNALYQLARALVSPGVAAQGGYVSPEDAVNFAGNVTLGGIGASGPVKPGVLGMSGGGQRKLRAEIIGKAADFKYGENADDFLYHVTTPEAAHRIVQEGFRGGRGKSIFGGAYANASKGKTFLTERGRIGHWRDRIFEGLEQEIDDVPELVVIRVPRSEVPGLSADNISGELGDFFFNP